MSPGPVQPRGRRPGFTLIEVLVAMLVGSALMYFGYQALVVLARGEKMTDRESARAIVQARTMEYLTRDLRSSVAVTDLATGHFRITRYVPIDGRLQTRTVEWQVHDGRRVTRQQEGEPVQEFNFTGLLEPNSPALALKMERTTDTVFTY